MTWIAGAVVSGTVGFLAGFFTFKVKLTWCRRCGATLSCPDCGMRPRWSR